MPFFSKCKGDNFFPSPSEELKPFFVAITRKSTLNIQKSEDKNKATINNGNRSWPSDLELVKYHWYSKDNDKEKEDRNSKSEIDPNFLYRRRLNNQHEKVTIQFFESWVKSMFKSGYILQDMIRNIKNSHGFIGNEKARKYWVQYLQTNVSLKTNPLSWRDRYEKAKEDAKISDNKDLKVKYSAYMDLLRDITGLPSSRLGVVYNRSDAEKYYSKSNTMVFLDLNINGNSENGSTYSKDIVFNTKTKKFVNIPKEKPIITLTINRFGNEHYLKETYFHELAHAKHFLKIIDLVHKYQNKSIRQSFNDWLSLQFALGKITHEEYLVSKEKIKYYSGGGVAPIARYDKDSTEIYASVNGFINGYKSFKEDKSNKKRGLNEILSSIRIIVEHPNRDKRYDNHLPEIKHAFADAELRIINFYSRLPNEDKKIISNYVKQINSNHYFFEGLKSKME